MKLAEKIRKNIRRIYFKWRYRLFICGVLLFWYRYISKKKEIVHFLHIGKTGGTAIKHAFLSAYKVNPIVTKTQVIFLHKHVFTLKRIQKGEKIFFFLRDPYDRFVSSFYSRKRKGLPRHYNPHTALEKKIFSYFETANEFAEALDADTAQGKCARTAMKQMQHIGFRYMHWFVSYDKLNEHADDILLAGNMETFTQDFKKIVSMLDLQHIELPTEKKEQHATPVHFDKTLSKKAKDNLKIYLEPDLDLMHYLYNKVC